MALKEQKELELRVHEAFYKNVHLLTMCYPPTQEFQEVFKKDMFIKNNKAGFHQVVYYLLGILNPGKLKEKVPTWPLYDVRREQQFRNEVMKYINELNSIHEDANIPQLATSHLISPGGFKFVKFIFKLSQLVLYEHCQSYAEISAGMLLSVKPSKSDAVTKENLQKLQIMTNKINEDTDKAKKDFEQRFETAKLEAQDIVRQQLETNERLKENQVRLQSLKQQFESEFPDLHNESDARSALVKKLESLKKIKENFDKCITLNSFLGSSDAKLEHNKNLKVPAEISHIVRFDGADLELASLVEGCNALIDRKRLEVKPLSDKELSQEIEKFGVVNNRFSSINEDLNHIYSELCNLSLRIQEGFLENSTNQKENIPPKLQIGNLLENDSDSTSSTLAEPLPPSPSYNNNNKPNVSFECSF